MRRLALLIAVGALWLFLAALPALADGGPHVASDNSGVSTLTADGCAGCHRAHTASAPLLLVDEEPDLCLVCHGSSGVGATTDVMNGVQYRTASTATAQDPNDLGVVLGALRNGGFVAARISSDDPAREGYYRNSELAVSFRAKVSVNGTSTPVTSAHMDVTNPVSGTAWGSGPNVGTAFAGQSMTNECTSCHNPHGNGQYRILKPIPTASGAAVGPAVTITSSAAGNERFTTPTPHGLRIGTLVTIAGHTGSTPDVNGTWTVASVPTPWTFTVASVDITTGGTGGTATAQAEVFVTDAPLPARGDTRNYTVLQAKGTQGTPASFLLYASQVEAARAAGSFGGITGDYGATGGDYFRRSVPWNPELTNAACDNTVFSAANSTACATHQDAPNGLPATGGPGTALAGQIAFNDQINAWCVQCHTRYYGGTTVNPNPDLTKTPPDPLQGSAWQYDSGDAIYKYRHTTASNRVCTTCHVSHGSNAQMPGDFSSTMALPDGTPSASSRLLKVDNRGTCQLCHDPTETVTAGEYYGPAPVPSAP